MFRTPLLVMILSVATCMSASIAFVAAVADESHFASLEVWTLLSGLGAASVAALTHTLYFRIRPAQWKRHYKGKTKKTAVVIAIVAAALGLAGVFGVLHSVLAAEDVGAAVWAATCVLWAGFLGVMAQQLGWKDSAASSAAASQRRRRASAHGRATHRP